MLDFTPLREKKQTIGEFTANITVDDLRKYSNESIDHILSLIEGTSDADVAFQPTDPNANDTFATNPDEANIAWNLGHVIVHSTASSEEAAALAAEQARGVEFHGRSRYETPWEGVTTLAQVHQRLAESRRIRLASLDMWPDQPHLENTVELSFINGPINPVGRFLVGLLHEQSHYDQIAEIVRQAKAARNG